MESDIKGWDKSWSRINSDMQQDRYMVEYAYSLIHWQEMEKRVQEKYGTFKDLKVIEIGSGRGEVALLMALKGAKVTLLDFSPVALEKAASLFGHFNCKATFMKEDVFNMPQSMFGNYDISMSFGFAEHFKYPKRQEVFKEHLSLLKDGGISFISVPNAYCFVYRLSLLVLKLLHKWDVWEVPFTHSQLRRVAGRAGYPSYAIIGSSSFGAIDQFVVRNILGFFAKRIGFF